MKGNSALELRALHESSVVRSLIAVVVLLCAPTIALAGVVICVENTYVPFSATTVMGSFEVFVTSDLAVPPDIYATQIRLLISPSGSGVKLMGVEMPTTHPYVFSPLSTPSGVTASGGAILDGSDFLLTGVAPLMDGQGLLKVNYQVLGNTPKGSYDIVVSTNFAETFLSQAAGGGPPINLPFTTKNGRINIVPLSTITPGTPPSNPGDALKPVNPVTTPPSGQLKRWDGNSWQPVSSWSNNGIDPTKPTVVIVHGWGDKIEGTKNPEGEGTTWTAQMAIKLHGQNENANILAWDWRSKAAVPDDDVVKDIRANGLNGAARCAANGDIQGVSLAHELQDLNISNASLQLIGHSNGGAVVGGAASELARDDQRVQRITTLDAPNLTLSEVPFAGTLVFPHEELKSTSVNAMQYVHPESSAQVEVYYSGGDAGREEFGFGAPISASYSNVSNGQIYAGSANPFSVPTWDHMRIVDWFSKDRSGVSPGPDQFVAAIDWSILSNNAVTNPWKSGNAAEQGFDSGLFKTTSITVPASVPLVKRSVDDFTQGIPWYGQHAEIVAVGNNGNYAAEVKYGSDGYLYRDVSIPADAYYLTFDLKIETPGAGDFLTVSLGDELLFYNALDTTDTDFKTVDPIFVGDFAGQTNTLLFALNHVGSGTPSILIDNVTFSAVPEPSTLALFAVVIVCLLVYANRRKKLSTAHH